MNVPSTSLPPSGFSPDAPFMFIPARASFFTRLLPTVNSTARSMLPHTKNQSPAAAASAMLCRAVGVSSQPPTTATASGLHSLEDLAFNNTFTAELPGDPSRENKIRQVHGALYSFVNPTPTGTEPTTIAYSKDVAAMIGLDPADCERPEFAMIFSGNAPLPGSEPYAQCYGGHQFGSWAGQLGDGRAISLGEVNAPGQDNVRWELQLKGAGMTPYSRRADGRAVLRSSLREFVASEAMHYMGVPTTRALSLVATGDQVVRDMFYSGNPQLEPGAVVCRVARSFIRFGTFQLPASRGDEQNVLVKQIADYVIKHYYQDVKGAGNAYLELLMQVARRTAKLVTEWHRVGFVHGVLNTDNMSILGDTIDYGPYGWLERFDPKFTPNTTDLPGRRYCFESQPEIGQFNIIQLALALIAAELITQDEARTAVSEYNKVFGDTYEAMMAKKIGIKVYDKELVMGLMQEMYEDSADYTNTFRALSSITKEGSGLTEEMVAAVGPLTEERKVAWEEWVGRYRALLRAEGQDDAQRAQHQNAVNPAIVPRNHVLVEIIAAAEEGNYEPLDRYMGALSKPYEAEGVEAPWAVPGPKQSRMGVELLSCSS